MDDLFQNGDEKLEVEPAELGPLLVDVLTYTLAKEVAPQYKKPWTEQQESAMQEKISALVAAARERGLKAIRVSVTRRNGEKASRELSVEKINQTRTLQ